MWSLTFIFFAFFCTFSTAAPGDVHYQISCANTKTDIFWCEVFENGTVVEIIENGTYWGRRDNTTCHSYKKKPKSWNCTLDIYEQLKKECDGKTSCQFTSSNEHFGADPCPGVRKYSAIAYTCRNVSQPTPAPVTEPPEEEVDGPTLCYTESMRVTCGKKKIKTTKVFFGRGDPKTCIYKWMVPFTKYFKYECDASDVALNYIKNKCDGKNYCDLWNIVGTGGGSFNANLSGSGHVKESKDDAIGANVNGSVNVKIQCTPAQLPYVRMSYKCVD